MDAGGRAGAAAGGEDRYGRAGGTEGEPAWAAMGAALAGAIVRCGDGASGAAVHVLDRVARRRGRVGLCCCGRAWGSLGLCLWAEGGAVAEEDTGRGGAMMGRLLAAGIREGAGAGAGAAGA